MPLCWVKLAFDLVDEFEVEFELSAQERDDEQQVLSPVGQRVRGRFGLGQSRGQIRDVFA
jgi:hypothetical protein